MRICPDPRCKALNKPDADFCSKCGFNLVNKTIIDMRFWRALHNAPKQEINPSPEMIADSKAALEEMEQSK